MRKKFFSVLIIFSMLSAIFSIVTFAQEQRPQTLFDLLFGTQNQQQVKKKPTRRVQNIPRKTVPRARVSTTPAIEKSQTATRLIVFGDSLAIDLEKALIRFYKEDPDLIIIRKAVGSSGFVRDDFFNWNRALKTEIANDSFDIAVVLMGINDKQNLLVEGKSVKPLTNEWKKAYSTRLNDFLSQLRTANKPVIWLGLPPMAAKKYSATITQISSLQRLAAFSAGAEFIDIYERFTGENGSYSSRGPNLSGQNVLMRKSDGIHFASAGSDKLAFYINQSLKKFYRGGTISLAVVDPLFGTDSLRLKRPPFQGLGQIRLLEVAGAITSLNIDNIRSFNLINATNNLVIKNSFDLNELVNAPVGRSDAFGVGIKVKEEATVN